MPVDSTSRVNSRTVPHRRAWPSPDEWLPTACVAVLGGGAAAALTGLGAGRHDLALVGAGLAATALVLLMAEGRVPPLVVLILTLPLPALVSTTTLRLAPAAPATALVLTAWMLGWPGRREGLRLARLPIVLMMVLIATFAFAALVSGHRQEGAREVANLGILLLLLVAATDLVAREPGRVRHLVLAVIVAASATGALAVLETLGVLPGRFEEPGGLNRAALGFGQPNGLGMFLALSLPFVVHARRTARGARARLAAAGAVALTAAGLIGTLSRGSWLSVLAGSLALLLAGGGRFCLKVWAVAMAGGVGVDLLSGGLLRDALFGLLQDWSVAQRAALMWAGVQMFLQNPLLGVGPGGFLPELDRVGWLVPRLWDFQPTPHNAYIQVAAETGLAGLAVFVAFLLALFRRAIQLARSPADPVRRSLHHAVLWAVAIALAEGMVEWPLSHGHGQLVMLSAALACALPLGRATADLTAGSEPGSAP